MELISLERQSIFGKENSNLCYWQPYPIMGGIFESKLWGKIWSCFPKGNPTLHPTLICQLIEQHQCRAVLASTLSLDNIGYIERGGSCWSLIKSFPHLGIGEDTPVMPHCFSKTWVKSKSSMYWHMFFETDRCYHQKALQSKTNNLNHWKVYF